MPPRWNKAYRTSEDTIDIVLNFAKKNVDLAIQKMKDNPQTDPDDMSILQKLILRNGPESSFPIVTAIDMIFAGNLKKNHNTV